MYKISKSNSNKYKERIEEKKCDLLVTIVFIDNMQIEISLNKLI